MERIEVVLALAAYCYVALVHLIPAAFRDAAIKRARIVGLVGVVLHALALMVGLYRGDIYGLPLALSAAALSMMVAYVWAGGRDRLWALGMFLAPLACVTLGTSTVVPSRQMPALSEAGASAWLPIHLALIFCGIAGFALAFAVGIAYLLVRRRLKRKDFSQLGRMPSLDVLDRIQFRSMLFGFAFLTLGIGVGGIYAKISLDAPWTMDPKIWFSLIIWLWYGIALQVRLVAGWRGRWSALFSIVGFGGLMSSLVLTNVLIRSWHGYGG